jgi:mRNA-degrading endonuclease RelE of RelBE toxin-antitoxin system
MNYRFSPAARRDLRKLETADARVIVDAIEAFADRGVGDVKKLKDYRPPAWRLRVGRFRVQYARDSEGMLIIAISDRRDAYR